MTAQGTATPGRLPRARHSGSRVLRDGDLVIELLDPGAPVANWYHTGPRFSPVAAVLYAAYRGRPFLFDPVQHDPATDHCGLAMEFDLHGPYSPPGFLHAPLGDRFLKVGVGVLTRDTEHYRFGHSYPIVQRADTRAEFAERHVHFLQTSPEVHGYAYRLEAHLQLQAPELSIHYRLTNTGARPLHTSQYQHNYCRFGDHDIGPNYRVQFPHPIAPTGIEPEQRVDSPIITFHSRIPTHVNIRVVVPPEHDAGMHHILVSQTDTAQQLDIASTAPVDYVAIHANPRYLAPEQFIRLDLAPGADLQWVRHYQFHA